MQRLTYIRFATYALFLLAIFWPSPRVREIPVSLVALESEEVSKRVDEAIGKRQDQEDIARRSGFALTTKSGREVMKIATAWARDGNDLSRYRAPTISLHEKDGRMQWLVSWELKGIPTPGGFFGVLIDDETGTLKVVEGK